MNNLESSSRTHLAPVESYFPRTQHTNKTISVFLIFLHASASIYSVSLALEALSCILTVRPEAYFVPGKSGTPIYEAVDFYHEVVKEASGIACNSQNFGLSFKSRMSLDERIPPRNDENEVVTLKSTKM